MGDSASGGDTGERRDGSGTSGRTRVRKPLGKPRKASKKPELRKALRGRTGPYWLAPKEDFSETILEEKEQAQF